MDLNERYLQQLTSAYPVLDRKRERQLLVRVHRHKDPIARELLFKHNVKLIISCVQKFCNVNDPRFPDLVQAGTLGIFVAIDRFDTGRRREDTGEYIKFSTLAVWWIMAGIRSELQKLSTKTPPSFQKLRADFSRGSKELRKQLKYTPNDEEVYAYLGWTEIERAAYEVSFERQVVSLSNFEPLLAEDTMGSDDLLDLDTHEQALTALHQEDLINRLEAALGELDPVEADIVRRYHGLSGYRKYTCEELADLFMMTREQVRDIQSGAMAQLWLLLEDLKTQLD